MDLVSIQDRQGKWFEFSALRDKSGLEMWYEWGLPALWLVVFVDQLVVSVLCCGHGGCWLLFICQLKSNCVVLQYYVTVIYNGIY